VVPASTSDAQRRRIATIVLVPKRTAGLPAESAFLCLRELERGLMAALQIGAFAS
jgi:hypothetical protein